MDRRTFLKHIFQTDNRKLLNTLEAMSEPRIVKRKQFLYRIGEQQIHLNILVSGVYRIYLVNEEGKEITDRFMAVPGQIINTEPVSVPSGEAAHALTDGEILRFPLDAVMELTAVYPELADFYRGILRENSLFYRNQHLTVHLSAAERYRRFAETEPAACAAANAGQIASYLGVARETVARMKEKTKLKL